MLCPGGLAAACNYTFNKGGGFFFSTREVCWHLGNAGQGEGEDG